MPTAPSPASRAPGLRFSPGCRVRKRPRPEESRRRRALPSEGNMALGTRAYSFVKPFRASMALTLPAKDFSRTPCQMPLKLTGCPKHVTGDFLDSYPLRHLREHRRAGAAHLSCVAVHHSQICSDMGREIGLVDDQEIRLGDSRAALARNLVSSGHVDDVDGEVRQLAAVLGREVVAAALDEEKLGR